MTLKKRLQLGVSACLCVVATATAALAGPQALSTDDAQRYAAVFEACDRGDFIDAQMKAVEIKDKSLVGYISFSQLMHPTSHKASFDELADWMGKFRDLPLADRIFALATKRKPEAAAGLPKPQVSVTDLGDTTSIARSDKGQKARDAFYAGDPKRALALASTSGERWIEGLAAYRLKAYDQALSAFSQLAQDAGEDAWLRSAAGFWGARSATALGDAAAAAQNLTLAAENPQTFYGMIAARQLRLQATSLAQNTIDGLLMRAAYVQPRSGLADFVAAEPRAHRAAALAQIGRLTDAGQEIRAGLALASTSAERERWTALAGELGAPLAAAAPKRALTAAEDYPTPLLEPKNGFTLDKALVYAVVRQESRFNPLAMSPVGAVGLMQLMPDAAARAAGDDKLKSDMSPLFDPAFNLRVGQDYLSWLMERGVGYDLLKVVAAYNGGPGTVQKTAQMLGDDGADPLMLIESLPALETRNYVEKVVAAYWTYKKMFGEETRTLDALAGGARIVDARIDLTQPTGPGAQYSAQSVDLRVN